MNQMPNGETNGAVTGAENDHAALVAAAKGGDSEAFAKLYRCYFDRIYAYLRLMLRDAAEAEDITQRVFMNALQGLDRYEARPDRPFRAWLFTIARNEAITYLRKSRRESVHDPVDLEQHREDPYGAELRSDALLDISDHDLVQFIERLPLAQRQVLALRYMLGLERKEIAEVLELTPNHVSVIHGRALRFLRDRLTAVGRAPATPREEPMYRIRIKAHVLRRRRFALIG
jgi:RNA polymerase sigma-70 factor (ECF subfamily)